MPPDPAAPAILDGNVIAALRELSLLAESDLLGSVIKIFERDSVDTVVRISAAVRADQSGDLQQALHRLKGSAATLGAQRVAALCGQMETAVEQSGTSGIARLLEHLEAELDHARAALAEAVAA